MLVSPTSHHITPPYLPRYLFRTPPIPHAHPRDRDRDRVRTLRMVLIEPRLREPAPLVRLFLVLVFALDLPLALVFALDLPLVLVFALGLDVPLALVFFLEEVDRVREVDLERDRDLRETTSKRSRLLSVM